jgi:UDP-xylose/UDP-N-acetylglucosamine transporter B4
MVMATAGSLTVNIVTTVRKLVSILLSVALFGNRLSGVQWCGAALVFGFSAWYGFLPKPASSAAPAAAVPKKKKDA